jgi:hypothetical protein
MQVRAENRETEISAAAIGSYARLLGAVPGRIETHGSPDGGLICERRIARGRSTIWRIRPDGSVVGDRPFDYGVRAFISAPLPRGI